MQLCTEADNVRFSLIADPKAPIISVDFPFHINGDLSARMMALLGEMAAGQEVYSIDDSFLDVTGINNVIPFETPRRRSRTSSTPGHLARGSLSW